MTYVHRRRPLWAKKPKRDSGASPVGESKAVICIDDGTFFLSVGEAAKYYGCSYTLISLQLSGKRKTAKGKTFMFLFDADAEKNRWSEHHRQRFSKGRKKYHELKRFRQEVLKRLEERGELGPQLKKRQR